MYRVISRHVTAAMFVSPTNPPGIELFYHANLFLFRWKNKVTDHVSENTPYILSAGYGRKGELNGPYHSFSSDKKTIDRRRSTTNNLLNGMEFVCLYFRLTTFSLFNGLFQHDTRHILPHL